MNIFKHHLGLSDFIPPVIDKISKVARQKKYSRFPPFNSIPYEIDAKWILDIGANYGIVTMAALKSYKDCQVICFEPVSSTFHQLQKNLSPYNNRVVLYQQALSNVNGESEINITSFHGANSLHHQSSVYKHFNPHIVEVSTEKINMVRLDDIAIEFPTKTVDVVKIDVEGHEINVLKGGSNFISNNVDTIIIEVSLMRDVSFDNQAIFELFSLLNSFDFRLINIMDLHHSNDPNLLLVQMDCIFRKKSKIKTK